ncbi:winged helix-turn-helix domain-containing protein [Serratia marcescens]|uniref:winged helix-turn-helix domain-containing protein n=1 Tax=Serratia marcescens TaxID=615 RepID=UPI003EE1177B
MLFMLSNALIFDPDTQKISLAGQPDSAVTLSAPAVRLLLEFIRNRGKELSREILITRVWQDFGYTPSGNNLNKAVSEIRKAFQSLGVHVSPIVTVPGKGFYFDADVTGQKRLCKAATIEPVPPPKKIKPLKRRLSISTLRPYRLAALVVSILIGGGYLFSEYAMKSSQTIKLPNEKLGQCTVWRINAPERPITLSKLPILLSENNLDCQRNKYDIYYFSTRFPLTNADEIFIGSCPENKKNLCKTIRYKSGVEK